MFLVGVVPGHRESGRLIVSCGNHSPSTTEWAPLFARYLVKNLLNSDSLSLSISLGLSTLSHRLQFLPSDTRKPKTFRTFLALVDGESQGAVNTSEENQTNRLLQHFRGPLEGSCPPVLEILGRVQSLRTPTTWTRSPVFDGSLEIGEAISSDIFSTGTETPNAGSRRLPAP